MPRQKFEIDMVRKNVMVPTKMADAMSKVTTKHGLPEAEIIRGALYKWLYEFKVASERLQNQMLEDAKRFSK